MTKKMLIVFSFAFLIIGCSTMKMQMYCIQVFDIKTKTIDVATCGYSTKGITNQLKDALSSEGTFNICTKNVDYTLESEIISMECDEESVSLSIDFTVTPMDKEKGISKKFNAQAKTKNLNMAIISIASQIVKQVNV